MCKKRKDCPFAAIGSGRNALSASGLCCKSLMIAYVHVVQKYANLDDYE